MDWYPNFAKDFLEGTAHMTNEEVGIYKRLLDHQWCRPNGRLPKDFSRLCRLVSMTTKKFKRIWIACLEEKFSSDSEGFYNERLERERQKALSKSRVRRAAGRRGAKTRWQTDGNSQKEDGQVPSSCDGNAISRASTSLTLPVEVEGESEGERPMRSALDGTVVRASASALKSIGVRAPDGWLDWLAGVVVEDRYSTLDFKAELLAWGEYWSERKRPASLKRALRNWLLKAVEIRSDNAPAGSDFDQYDAVSRSGS